MVFLKSAKEICQGYAPRVELYIDALGVKYIKLRFKSHIVVEQFDKKNMKKQVEYMTCQLAMRMAENHFS